LYTLLVFKLTPAPHTTPRRSQVSTQQSPSEGENEAESESLKSSKSLGLDAAEFKALYPSINEDVGLDNTPVSQDMIELVKSIGVKIPPANPSQVKRDKKSAAVDTEDDFSKEKYSHSTSNHTTFVQGLTRIPFNIFECTPFLDFVRASGLDFAAKLPSLSELQEKLDDIKTDYPGSIFRPNAKRAELSAALVKKKVKKAGPRRSTRSKKGKGKEKAKEQERRRRRRRRKKTRPRWLMRDRMKKGVKLPKRSRKSRNSRSPISGDTLLNLGRSPTLSTIPPPKSSPTELQTTPRPRPGLKRLVSATLPPTKPHQVLPTEEQDFPCPCPLDSLSLSPPPPLPMPATQLLRLFLSMAAMLKAFHRQ
jgi:hypothetical protein